MNQANTIQGRLITFKNWQRMAEQQTGKSALRQIREILALRKMGGRCGLSDYYWYKLYDAAYLNGRGVQDFLGWRLQAQVSLALNPRHVVLPAWDKIVFMTLADSVGLPVVPTAATFKACARLPGIFGKHLRTRDEAAEFLRDPCVYPLFGKPAYSQQGYGSAYIDRYEPALDRLVLLDGGSISVEEFLKRLDTTVDYRYHRPECGYLFQRPLRLAEPIESLTGWKAICGARVICLNGPEGSMPLRAIWKIAVPPNHVDNFSLGKYGNLLADIDPSSGSISRVIGGLWPETHLLGEHPVSGNPFTGFRLPDWSAVINYCQMIGQMIPMMRIQHIDFAFSDSGPRVLELNDIGSTELAQLHGHGLLTESACRFIKRFGNADTYSWIKGL
ncbi:hypothetical protein LZ012_14315 [Dechloromonas sp. XY25]|uniref:Alpha-L-glutamate ligase-related protein ATP-grasp domain-containing protein n=1 Tax=Dechloromonas hankyongensis TaxID=2908002 RepID=A0ABS9K4T9_9RHOO|nr:sugar-transfer associated ATP-grasp domain-containing protein [Dechloromonas hankyongensis]MCG2578166.1 hypothetical protein [Dechloromonas hankyongensis]